MNLPIYCLGLILSSCSKEQPIALQTSSICSSSEVAERNPKTDFEVMLVVALQAADFFSAIIPLMSMFNVVNDINLRSSRSSLPSTCSAIAGSPTAPAGSEPAWHHFLPVEKKDP